MPERFISKKLAPVALQALREALTHIYWYKSDLRSFLTQCLSDPAHAPTHDLHNACLHQVDWLVPFLFFLSRSPTETGGA